MAEDGELAQATARLDRALAGLEARLKARRSRPTPVEAPPPADDLFARLEVSDRERALEAAAEEASAALARAADEVRVLLKGAA